ncbi:MAG: hypothetical protein JW940_37495 [Polyangiaceae bacterium]|nr:hypothetical protein [Polyangiaceae bacterium]
MRGCVRQLTKKQRTWAGVLGLLSVLGAVALVPGCGCGGWTGGWCAESSSEDGSGCSDQTIAYEQHSVQGPSAQELIADHGGTRLGTSRTVSEAFWTATGLEPTSSSMPFELNVTYADGEVLENTCTPSLTVAVELTVKLGSGLAAWQVPAELELVSGDVSLSAVLPAAGTALSADLDLYVQFDAETATAWLRPVSGPADALAEFVIQ